MIYTESPNIRMFYVYMISRFVTTQGYCWFEPHTPSGSFWWYRGMFSIYYHKLDGLCLGFIFIALAALTLFSRLFSTFATFFSAFARLALAAFPGFFSTFAPAFARALAASFSTFARALALAAPFSTFSTFAAPFSASARALAASFSTFARLALAAFGQFVWSQDGLTAHSIPCGTSCHPLVLAFVRPGQYLDAYLGCSYSSQSWRHGSAFFRISLCIFRRHDCYGLYERKKIFFVALHQMTYDNDPTHAPTQQELDYLPNPSVKVPLVQEREKPQDAPRRAKPMQQPVAVEQEAEADRTEMYVMMAGIATVWLSLFLF
jgi:hypothetical protein